MASLLATALAVATRGARAQELPAGYDAGLFELHANTLSSNAALTVITPDGQPLSPLDVLMELTGTPLIRAGSRVRVPGAGGVDTATLDLAAGRAYRSTDTLALAPTEAVRYRGGTYLSTRVLAFLLQARATVSWADLRISFDRRIPYPVEQTAALELERQRRKGIQAGREVTPTAPYLSRTGAGILEWSLSSSNLNPLTLSSAYGALGVAVLGGQVEVGGNVNAGTRLSGPELYAERFSADRIFPGGRIVQRVTVGDLLTEGSIARSVRGFLLTNAPYRREQFAAVPVQPRVPTGWQYEVYQDGQLLGVSGGGTAAPVEVPLRYGQTPVQVRMYGPAGETLTSNYVYVIPATQVPAGRIEYSVGGGKCPSTDCRAVLYADARYGLGTSVTVGSGFESLRDSTGTSLRPSASMSLALPGGVYGDISALQGAFLHGTMQAVGTNRFNALLAGGIYDRSYHGGSFLDIGRSSWDLMPSFGLGSSRFAATLAGPLGEPAQLVRLNLVRSIRRGLLGGSYERNRFQPAALLGLNATVFALQRPGMLLGMAGGIQAQGSGRIARTDLTASLSGGRSASASASWRYDRAGGSSLVLSCQSILNFSRSQAQVTAGHGRTAASYSASGAIGFDPRNGVGFASRGGIGFAGVGGRVFYDTNADGRFSAGERPLSNAEVIVGSIRTRTDRTGRWATWEVIPYEAVRAAIDTLTALDPEWMPSRAYVDLRPSPHVLNRVDFALVQTRELAGRIVSDTTVASAAGITVVLTNKATGEQMTAVTFSDGEYYYSRVRPGTYHLAIAPSSLQALRASAEPSDLEVTIDANGPSALVEPPPFRIRRAD